MPSDFDEAAWWGDCANTWHEEEKQLVYAARMGLMANWQGGHPPTFDIEGRSVIDIGGGPVSLLLKCVNRGECAVLDPAKFPAWVWKRYAHAGISTLRIAAEKLDPDRRWWDEAWLYNVLQHVSDPALVVANARTVAPVVRVFEWLHVDPYPGHPHRLEREQMDEWLGGRGYVANLDERGCVGTAYYGVFGGIFRVRT